MPTFNTSVSASADDAVELTDVVTLTDTTITASESDEDFIGVRFQNVTVPQGATITNAYLTFYCPDSADDDPNHDIWGQDADTTSAFTTSNNDISGRTRTTATVSWSSTNLGAPGSFDSPDLTTIVQEIVNRAGWSSGNSMVFIIMASAPGRALAVATYDHATFDPPELTIVYSGAVTHEITVTDNLGFEDNAARQLNWERTIVDNLGLADAVSDGVVHNRIVTDNLGLADNAADLGVGVQNVPTFSDNMGFSDNVIIETNFHNILVTDNLGFSDAAGPPDTNAPTATWMVTLECEVTATTTLDEKQTATVNGGTVRVLTGHRYRR